MESLIHKNEKIAYLLGSDSPSRRQYLVLIRFYIDHWNVERIASEYGYAPETIYTITSKFSRDLAEGNGDPFFIEKKPGRKAIDRNGEAAQLAVDYRKQYYSVPEIKAMLDAGGYDISERLVTEILREHGFARLPRRADEARNEVHANAVKLVAPKSQRIRFDKLEQKKDRDFSTREAGLLCFLPIIRHYGIDRLINDSGYPASKYIGRLESILCFLALKLTNKERYSADDKWCFDRGMGMFAGLNVLPKTAWFSSYSDAVTRETNLEFLKGLQKIWSEAGILSDTANLDFTAIPYWGDDKALENNWSGKRGRALASLQAVIAQDPHNGIICYGDATVRHDNQNDVVLEFLDFCHTDPNVNKNLKYLVFDSRFTTYENLGVLNKRGVKFITIQRRGAKLLEQIASIPQSEWKDIKIEKANNKHRTVRACERSSELKDYDGRVRQIFLDRKDRQKPAIIITNDLLSPLNVIVRKYALRWMAEKEISEQIHFFHLNRNSSGIVVKVDFDLTMSILAHNLYRLLAMHLEGHEHCEAATINAEFTQVGGIVSIGENQIDVKLNRLRNMHFLLEMTKLYENQKYPWLNNKPLNFMDGKTT